MGWREYRRTSARWHKPHSVEPESAWGLGKEREGDFRYPGFCDACAPMIIHLGQLLPTGSSNLPECEASNFIAFCSVLLPMRLAMRLLLPEARWSLAPPFHPYPNGAVYFLLRSLSGRPGRPLTAIVLCGARKFLVGLCRRDHLEVSQRTVYSDSRKRVAQTGTVHRRGDK